MGKSLFNVLSAVFLMITVFVSSVAAKMVLPSIISDNMVLQRDTFVNLWGWANPGDKVCVSAGWQNKKFYTAADNQGRWLLRIRTPADKGPYSITIDSNEQVITLKDILMGEVWICSGQSNMAFSLRNTNTANIDIPKANKPQIRYFGIKQKLADEPQEDCQGKWQICKPEIAAWHSGIAYYFAHKVHAATDVPVGIIQTAVGGTPAESWMSKDVLLSNSETAVVVQRYDELMKTYPVRYEAYNKEMEDWKKIADNFARKPHIPMGPEHYQRPYGLWNGMINPLLNFRIAGVLWYQGEGNSWRAFQYRDVFPMLIQSWRQQWKQGNFPFYYVQIAPYEYDTPLIAAELRQAQTEALKVVNTAMVCTMDIGDANDIHPRNKKTVGERLAGIALNRIYNKSSSIDCGPIYAGMRKEGKNIRIYFSNADNGLKLEGKTNYFEIAGQDNIYHKAQVVVEGDTLVVNSDEVAEPQNVRYGWSNTAGASLFNIENFPASPFRTDNKSWTTKDKNTYF